MITLQPFNLQNAKSLLRIYDLHLLDKFMRCDPFCNILYKVHFSELMNFINTEHRMIVRGRDGDIVSQRVNRGPKLVRLHMGHLIRPISAHW